MFSPAGRMAVFSSAVHALHGAEDLSSGITAMTPFVMELFAAKKITVDLRAAAFPTAHTELYQSAVVYRTCVEFAASVEDKRALPPSVGVCAAKQLEPPGKRSLLRQSAGQPIFWPFPGADELTLEVKGSPQFLRIIITRNSRFEADDFAVATLLEKHLACRFHSDGRGVRVLTENAWSLVLGADFYVEAMPEGLRLVLSQYFEAVDKESSLPAELGNWLRRYRRGDRASRHPFSSDHFHVARPHGCLRFRLQPFVDGNEAILTIREERGACDFYRLHALGLTERECEVMFWITQGKADGEISVILGAARKTISKHVENILLKLSAGNRTAAAIKVVRWLGDPLSEAR
jgi:DNA-binding CsgD family transcriptional regulator